MPLNLSANAFHRRPGLGEPVVGHPSEQQRFGVECFVELEPVAFIATIDLEGPPGVLEVLAPTRRLHHAVERDELGYHDPSHLISFC
jgi:hypothetical protein